VPKDFGGARGRWAKAKQRLDERGFARAVRTEQANGPAGEGDVEILQDLAFPETHAQPGEFNDWWHGLARRVFQQ
jgi:hypothetical protein